MLFEGIDDSKCLGKEPMEFRAEKRRRNFIGQIWVVPSCRGPAPQIWEKSFCIAERSWIVLVQKSFSNQKFKYFSASRTHPQTMIS